MTASIRRRTGVAMMSLVLIAAMIGLTRTPVGAQEEDEQALEAESSALYAAPLSDVIPDTLADAFPPAVLCIVAGAQDIPLCSDDLQPLYNPLFNPDPDGIPGILQIIDQETPHEPVHPLPPDSVTVAIFAGAQRYMSALKFAVPEPPAGEEVDDFTLTFPELPPSYALSSPMFRQAMLAAVAAAGSQDPEVFQEELVKVLGDCADEPGPDCTLMEPVDQNRLGIEVCPLTEPFEEDPEPPVARGMDEIPGEERNGEISPAVNCIFGANGVYDADELTWTFDLTLAAAAWADGSLENHGVLFRSSAAPNLAFGDPDPSSYSQTILGTEGATLSMSSSEPVQFAPFVPPPDSGGSLAPGPDAGGFFAAPPPADAPAFEPPSVAADPPGGPPEPVAAGPLEAPSLPWWFWLLVPLFVGGAWMTAGALTAEAVVAGSRPGAMTRLLERQGPPPMSQV